MTTCLYCGTGLSVPTGRGRKPKFCDNTCKERFRLDKNRRITTDKVCEQCGNHLNQQQFKSGARYCSQECAHKAARTLKNTHRRCIICGNDFEPRYNEQKCCGLTCSKKAGGRSLTLKTQHQFECKYCGKSYTPKAKDRKTYCSRYCAFMDKAAKPKPQKVPSACKWCGQPADSARARFCSDKCRKALARTKSRDWSLAKHNAEIKAKFCKCCRQSFTPAYGSKRRSFCSLKCQRTYSRRIGTALRRARIRLLPYEPIDPIAVFERDDWICYMCQKVAPASLRGTTDPLAPELDHIIPLAKGGHHIWSNVACCHRKCNQDKADTLMNNLHSYKTEEKFLDEFPSLVSAAVQALNNDWVPNYSASDTSRRNYEYSKSTKQLDDLVFESAWVRNDANGVISAQIVLESSHRSVTVQVEKVDDRFLGAVIRDVTV
jgi:hypothetical protein